jgi:hypothetical protein
MREKTEKRFIPEGRLLRQMSEVISLREQVAQAELSASVSEAALPNVAQKLAPPQLAVRRLQKQSGES